MHYGARSVSVKPAAAPSTLVHTSFLRRTAVQPAVGLHPQLQQISVMTMSANNNRKRTRAGSPNAVADRGAVLGTPSSSPPGPVSFKVPGLIVTNHTFIVPLDWDGKEPGAPTIKLFVREIHSPTHVKKSQPWLLYLQGGPGFESPRPCDASGWIKSAVSHFRVVLLDQRGTGRSSAITVRNLQKGRTPEQQAHYLSFFRADSIVKDAEFVRSQMVAKDNCGGRWSVLGQSFGGFCAFTYMSIAPQGLLEVMLTGGIPPGVDMPCSADHVYRALYKRVILANVKYYQRFPEDVSLVQQITHYLAAQPGGGLLLPSGTLLTPRLLQTLGLSGLGSGGGFERLHFLLESFFDSEGDVTPTFCKSFEAWHSWDTNPLYALVHESIYCQGAASNWSAHRIREQEFKEVFEPLGSAGNEGGAVYFTGEMVYPWMFDDVAALKPYKAAAELLASKEDWGQLYNTEALAKATMPVAAASYVEDMYVDWNLAQATAAHVRELRQWSTNEFKHSGIRDDGGRILDRLLNMVRDAILVD